MKFLEIDSKITEVMEAMKTKIDPTKPGGFAVVVNGDKTLVGVISDSDLRRSFLENDDVKANLLAKDLMKKDFVYIYEDELKNLNFKRLTEVMDLRNISNKTSIQFIPVVNTQMQVLRVIHITDLIEAWKSVDSQIVIIGLGFVGLTLSLAFASKHKAILGVDTNIDYVNELKSFKSRIYEPDIELILKRTLNKKLILTNSLDLYPRNRAHISRNFIICVGTPLLNGIFDKSQLESAIKLIAADIQKDDAVVFRSTVPIGFTREAGDIIQGISGLQAGVDFALCYAPERTVEGNAIKECTIIPQLYSGLTENCSKRANQIFSFISDSQIRTESLEACELGKLMTNAFRDVSFGFANEMASIAKGYNLDINKLIENVNLGYSRNQIAKPSPGVGGPCLSKDSYLLAVNSKKMDNILIAARHTNEDIPLELANELVEIAKDHEILNTLIIGIAFKGEPETNDIRNSTGVMIASKLDANGLNLRIADCIVSNFQIKQTGLIPYDISEEWKPSLVCILNNHKQNINQFQNLLDTLNPDSPVILFDPWYLCPNLYEDIKIKTVLTMSKKT